MSSTLDLHALRTLTRNHFSWRDWADRIETHGVTIERPAHSTHPDYPSVIYPIDYGFLPDTTGTDGEAVDAFVGTGTQGLVGLILTTDYRQDDREVKLIVDCLPSEIYTVHGFINYDRTLLEGVLVLRTSMPTLWHRRRD